MNRIKRHKQWIFTLNLRMPEDPQELPDPDNLEAKRLIEKVRSHFRTG